MITATNRLIRRALIPSVAVLLGSLALGLSAHGGAAHAATVDRSGSPGYASFPRLTADESWNRHNLSPNNYYVGRSSAYGGTQTVTVTVRAWGYNAALGKWVYDKAYASSTTLQPGQAGWIYFNSFEPYYINTHVDVIVTWKNAWTGQIIGITHADATSVNDYYAGFGTAVYANSYVGAYIHYN